MVQDPSALDRRTLFKATLGVATVAVVGTELAAAAPAHADDPFGFVLDCDAWGARPPADPLSISGNTTNKIIVHHMAFPNVTDYSEAHAKQLARDCQDLHMDTNGWSDTGQHFTVSRGGYVLEGRHRSLETLKAGEHQVIAAHCPGENGNAIGIENEGTYVTETPPQALLDSLTRLCATVCRQYGLHAYDIFGHWDFRDTDCPGIAFYREFPMLRRAVQHALGEHPGQAPARRWPDIWRFVGGPVVRLGQYLLNARGYQLATDGVFGATTLAAVQDWQQKQGLAVDPDGTFTTDTWETLVSPVYRDGSGPAVAGLQFLLNHKGYALPETGGYDKATQGAVQQVQRLHGLRPTGKVDVTTWCAIVGGTVREALSA
ncbi:MAG TPA: N-acetylmuramoyl-L-alanine amidase [Actinocatenispora sp.]